MRFQLGQIYEVSHCLNPLNLFFGEIIIPAVPLAPAFAALAVRHLVEKFEILRSDIRPSVVGNPMTVRSADDRCFEQAFDYRHSSSDPATLRERLAQYVAEARKTMGYGKAPLFRYGLFSCGHGRHQRLVFVISHLLCDGISSRVLWREFSRAYRRAAAGALPPASSNGHFRRLGVELLERRRILTRSVWPRQATGDPERSIDIFTAPGRDLALCRIDQRKVATRRFDGGALARLRQLAQAYGISLAELFLVLLLTAFTAEFGEGRLAIAHWFTPHFIGSWRVPVHDLVGAAAFPMPFYYVLQHRKTFAEDIAAMQNGLSSAMEGAADFAAWYYAPMAVWIKPALPAIGFNFVGDSRRSPDSLAYQLAPEEMRIGRPDHEMTESPFSCDLEIYGDMLELTLAARPDHGLAQLPALLLAHMEKNWSTMLSLPIV